MTPAEGWEHGQVQAGARTGVECTSGPGPEQGVGCKSERVLVRRTEGEKTESGRFVRVTSPVLPRCGESGWGCPAELRLRCMAVAMYLAGPLQPACSGLARLRVVWKQNRMLCRHPPGPLLVALAREHGSPAHRPRCPLEDV